MELGPVLYDDECMKQESRSTSPLIAMSKKILILPVLAAFFSLTFSGCVSSEKPPHYAAGTPNQVVQPAMISGHGYGYWYSGKFWEYRKGYSFYKGHYYNGTGRLAGNGGYGGDGGWSPNGGYRQ